MKKLAKYAATVLVALHLSADAAAVPVAVSTSAWDGNPVAWKFDAESATIETTGISDMAVLAGERCARMELSAIVVPRAPGTNGWSILGIALCDDDRNYWHLAFVQAPPKKETASRTAVMAKRIKVLFFMFLSLLLSTRL